MVQNRDNIDSEIVLSLLESEKYLRDIARSLKTPHSTIQRRISDLINENVLGYKWEGKNKVLFIKKNLQAKNYVFNAERYKLIKLLRKYPECSIIIDELLRGIDSAMIVLFGSYAKFMAKRDSDIDIYIETKDKKIKESAESINSRIKAKIGSFDLNSALVKEIIKNHVILKGGEKFYEKTRFFG